MAFLRALLAICLFILSSCGYQFQGIRSPFQEAGIKRVYVRGFRNETFRPGVEQLFTGAMIREIRKSRVFELVDSEQSADAILTGTITTADSSPSSTSAVTVGVQEQQVAAQYNANIVCQVTLMDRQGRSLYAQSVGKSKLYPGLVLKGNEGATVPLTNESEQRLAYQSLASQMMGQAYQQMVDLF